LTTVLDHVGVNASDYERSRAFYEAALAPFGIVPVREHDGAATGFGESDGRPFFWVQKRPPPVRGGLHVAFTAQERPIVDAFHAAGLAAGGTDNGAPGVREIYHPHYYGAFLLDPDGNNIEAVCHKPPH
jgi:catechol 2,3-dioxygenase-like lactoylglutathione lyase family enzyme